MLLNSLRRERADERRHSQHKLGCLRSEGETVTVKKQSLSAISINSIIIKKDMAEDKPGRTTALQVLRLTVLWFNSPWKVARTRDSTTIVCKKITTAAHGCNPPRVWAQHWWKSSLGSLLPLQSSTFFSKAGEGFLHGCFLPTRFSSLLHSLKLEKML